ncbi:hypothetical protein KIW84_074909 [Lathyrus oleraceus]|uniref:Uncharacterized protein n=1 Tax=Pisum sativum TaxID=3888 RepID=A0A9D4VU12_PEA|nr:hypothetical protein KIW84_074909 [Pisum sativum]
MTWDEIDVVGVPPSPRSDHAVTVHVGRYFLIFGGGSHATCYNDLHVLDLQTMEWISAGLKSEEIHSQQHNESFSSLDHLEAELQQLNSKNQIKITQMMDL